MNMDERAEVLKEKIRFMPDVELRQLLEMSGNVIGRMPSSAMVTEVFKMHNLSDTHVSGRIQRNPDKATSNITAPHRKPSGMESDKHANPIEDIPLNLSLPPIVTGIIAST
jgi:hypothetical protein